MVTRRKAAALRDAAGDGFSAPPYPETGAETRPGGKSSGNGGLQKRLPNATVTGLRPHGGHGRVLVGLDRVSLSFPVAGFDRQQESGSSVAARNPRGQLAGPYGGTSQRVGGRRCSWACQRAVGRAWGKVKFNPSRVLDPDGWGLVHPDDLGQALTEVVPMARQYLRPAAKMAA